MPPIGGHLPIVNDVISGVEVEQVGMDIGVKFSDSRQKRFRDIRLPHFVTDERRPQPSDPVA